MDGPDIYDSIIYAIQVSDSLLQSVDHPDGSGSKPLSCVQAALQAAEETIRHQMIVNPSSSFGIILFGVEGASNNCTELIQYGAQDSLAVKKIMRLARDNEELSRVIKPSQTSVSLSDVFHLTTELIQPAVGNKVKRLVLVTNDDLADVSSQVRSVIKTRLHDLVQSNVVVQPVFVQIPSLPAFKPEVFWSDVTLSPFEADSNLDSVIPDPVSPDCIKAVVLSRSMSRGSVSRLELFINDLSINVCAYRLFSRRKFPTPRKVAVVDSKRQIATVKTKYVVENTGKIIAKDELSRAYKFGPDFYVPVTDEQLKELNNFGDPAIRIMDFRPRTSLVNIGSISPSIMIYPNAAQQLNAREAYSAIHQTLLENNLFATASAIFRRNSAPVLGVLYATTGSMFSDSHTASVPAALHFVALPYVDDLRALPPNDLYKAEANDELIDAFGNIIEKLTMKQPFNPRKYFNPRIQWCEEVIEATALSLEMPEMPEDNTIPSYNSINTRAGAEIHEFNRLLDEFAPKDEEESVEESEEEQETKKQRLDE